MESIKNGYRAVVIGASGGIGGALTRALERDSACEAVHALVRSGAGPQGARILPGRIDIADPASIEAAAQEVAAQGPPGLVIVATGYLHGDGGGPEKRWREITAEGLARSFALNATGPALVARHFLDIMPRQGRSVFAALSARVGSISDNRAGGWYGYRASKAALNQILKCLAIEGARTRPDLVIAGLQPGTVRTALSAPFRRSVPEDALFEPAEAAEALLGVLDRLEPGQSGGLFDWSGAEIAP